MAGHVGAAKTYWRIAAQFWWPRMPSDIYEGVQSCAHCILANNVSHKTRRILKAVDTAEPFDIMSFDIWYPGMTMTDGDEEGVEGIDGDKVRKNYQQRPLLTGACTTTMFAGVALVDALDSRSVRTAMFTNFFIPNGFPKRIIVDKGSEFAGVLKDAIEYMDIPMEPVSPQEHQGVLVERFHRFLNKVQRIQGMETLNHEEYFMNALFATYAWNSAPIDGTNVQRSFVAKARTFNFPFDTATEEPPPIGNPGQRSIDHLESVFPLWHRQKEIYKKLIEDRREYHRELHNKSKKQRTFEPGDLVVIRRQVNSVAAQGRPEKLQIKAKGIYRVLQRCSPDGDDYTVQKIPAVERPGSTPGAIQKESAARMTKIPSTVVVNRRLDSADQRWVGERITLHDNPLDDKLGLYDFGKFVKAQGPDAEYAFDRVEDMYEINLDPDDDLQFLNEDHYGIDTDRSVITSQELIDLVPNPAPHVPPLPPVENQPEEENDEEDDPMEAEEQPSDKEPDEGTAKDVTTEASEEASGVVQADATKGAGRRVSSRKGKGKRLLKYGEKGTTPPSSPAAQPPKKKQKKNQPTKRTNKKKKKKQPPAKDDDADDGQRHPSTPIRTRAKAQGAQGRNQKESTIEIEPDSTFEDKNTPPKRKTRKVINNGRINEDVETVHPPMTAFRRQKCETLVKNIENSIQDMKQRGTHEFKSKLFFAIRKERQFYQHREWHIVSVDPVSFNSERTLATGKVHVKFWVRAYGHANKKPIRNCAVWPNLHREKNGYACEMTPTAPTLVMTMQGKLPEGRIWYQDSIYLVDDMICGPFRLLDGYMVPDDVWESILARGEEDALAQVELPLYTGNIDRVVPLGEPDKENPDENGRSYAHLARKYRLPTSFMH